MASIPLVLRVHATGCAFPMCDTPQALDIGADGESGEMLVDGVVHHLENAMMQAVLIRITDEHTWPFANRFQAL